jgi:hypothetical protein
MTKLEEVARALDPLAFAKGWKVRMDTALEQATAAIAAMRRPTPEQIAAAWTVIDADKVKTGIARLGPGLGVCEIYAAMIDACDPMQTLQRLGQEFDASEGRGE